MADNGLGFSLEIPDKFLKDAAKADLAIEQLAKRSEDSSARIVTAFKQMSDMGVQPFLNKLNEANASLANFKMKEVKIPLSGAEQYSDAITKAMLAVNKLNTSEDQSRKIYVDKISMYSQMFDRIERNEKAIEKQVAAQRKLNQAQAEESRKAQLGTYGGAMDSSRDATTMAQRISAINNLKRARQDLSTTDVDYNNKLNTLNKAILLNEQANKKAVEGSKELKKAHTSVMDTSDQLTRKLALIFSVSQIQGYVMNMIKVRGEFELQNRALQAILQNKDEADKLFGRITELAVRSPFQVKELVTYTKQLAAYRVETEKLYDTTKMLADVSAGLGVDMSRLILAYGQVKAANYLRGTELRQFSEAGINILGELATYYTELEGRMISVGDVQERVTNRMVAFGDVENIFKRITSAGGIFYNMQEIQAETLSGQMSNLTDSIDIMFNKIGQANDGALKDAVAAVRTLVENWETVAVILKATGVAFTFYTVKVALATIANKAFAQSNIEATVAAGGLQKALSKTWTALGNGAKFLIANPLTLLIGLIAGTGFALFNHNKKVKEAKDQYDILNSSLTSSSNEIKRISSNIAKEENTIKSLNNSLSQLTKGTDEYSKKEESINASTKNRNALLNELKNKHPEVYAGIVKQKDGTVDLTTAQIEYNKQLEQTLTLNALMQNEEGWFDDGIMTVYSELADAQKDHVKNVEQTRTAYNLLVIDIQKVAATNTRANDIYQTQLKQIIKGQGSYFEKLKQIAIISSSTGFVGSDNFMISNKAYDILSKYNLEVKNYAEKMVEANSVTSKLFANIFSAAGVDSIEAFKALPDSAKKSAIESARAFINTIPSIKEAFIQDFVNQKFIATIGVSFDFSTESQKEYLGMNKRIKDYIEKNKLDVTMIKPDEGMSEYFDKLRGESKAWEEEEKKLKLAIEDRNDAISNGVKLLEGQAKERDRQKTLTGFGEQYIKPDKTDPFKARISIIKEAGKAYEEYLKYYDKETAKLKTQEAYKDAFKEAGIGDMAFSMDFDVSGVIAGLETLLKSATGKTRKLIQKELAEQKTKVGIDVVIADTEKINKQFEDMFAGYELTIEMGKLGLDKETTAQIFNVDIFDTKQIRKRLEEMKAADKAAGTERLEEYTKIEQKITDMEQKERLERLKEYSFYLKKSMSERVSIELEGQKKIADIPAEFTEPQRERAKQAIKKETSQKLDKQDWKDFQDTDLYIKMFEDLESTSSKTLAFMEEKLISLRSSLKNLSPQELKEINNQIDKIGNAKLENNPFAGLTDNIKEYIEFQKERKILEEEYRNSITGQSFLESSVQSQEKLVNSLEKEYSASLKNEKLSQKEKNAAKEKLDTARLMLNTLLSQLVAQGKITDEYAAQLAAGERMGKSLKGTFEKIGSKMTEFSTGIMDAAGGMENIFGKMDAKTEDTVSSVSEIAGGIGEAVSGFASGNYLQAAIGVVKTIGAVFAIGDKKREREIQREIKKVQQLQETYQALEKSIQDAYSFDSLTAGNKQMEANLKAQNESLRKMISAEDDKKKTDKGKIDEWNKQIAANNEMIKENAERLTESLGGLGSEANIKSAAENFASAWLDSFNEVGDGMKGLDNSWDDFINNMMKKQLAGRLSSKYFGKLFNQFDDMFAETSEGGENVVKSELDRLKSSWDVASEGFNEAAKKLMESLGLKPSGGEGELSGLSKGIANASEKSILAVEALLNSLRSFVADSNLQLKNLYLAFSSGDITSNPMLAELRAQTVQVTAINRLLSAVIGHGHPTYGGDFLKCGI